MPKKALKRRLPTLSANVGQRPQGGNHLRTFGVAKGVGLADGEIGELLVAVLDAGPG